MSETGTAYIQHVSDGASLNAAIAFLNGLPAGSDMQILLNQPSITLSSDIASINPQANVTCTIQPDGKISSVTIDGAGIYRGFVILNGIITLSGLELANMQAMPFNKKSYGALAAGGGLFVANAPSAPYGFAPGVTLKNVSFVDCGATGADGAPWALGWASPGGDGGPAEHDGSQGQSVQPFFTVWGPFGIPQTSGSFGVIGATGDGGDGGEKGNNSDGQPGQPGQPGLQSGYGAGASMGGGGGGGGGGDAKSVITTWIALPGGAGGTGGQPGSPGFGGSSSPPPSQGQPGDVSSGQGGSGGAGSTFGAGAGFGGGMFLMDNAHVTISGQGLMTGGKVKGGSCAPFTAQAAGTGIFLQGAGTLVFNTPANETFTIHDEITDEKGSGIAGSAAVVPAQSGSDGLRANGGDGAWSLTKQGAGSLVLAGKCSLAGNIDLQNGTLDFGSNTPHPTASMAIGAATLAWTPNSQESFVTGTLSVEQNSTIQINSNATFSITSLNAPGNTFKVICDAQLLNPNESFTFIESSTAFPANLKVAVNAGLTCDVQTTKIVITKPGPPGSLK